MKINLVIAVLVVSLVSYANASGLPAPLPEFKSPEQFKKLYTEAHSNPSNGQQTKDSNLFYTGKPVEYGSGSYLFKNRTYNAEIARWTSSDPSGFPDGSNNQLYAPIPTCEFDYQGLQAHRTFGAGVQDISLSVGVYDPTNTITQSQLYEWKDAVIDAWKFTGIDKSNQEDLFLQTYISFTFITGTYDQATALQAYDNVVTFGNQPLNTVSNSRVGLWNYGIPINIVVHEIGHFMQAPDMYTETSPLPNRVTTPNAGWSGTIMGDASTPATKKDANLILQSLGETTHLFE